ncbi:hypothetical protein [Paraherbaspirillum soli]|uniref:Uncharacterized protein n=1 Tax=Paraherbaspirillum soli TaxID=631222 RepID=A0ABW0M6E0_9BURK
MTSDNKPKEPQQPPAEAEEPKAPASKAEGRSQTSQQIVAAQDICEDLISMAETAETEGLTREEAVKLAVSMRTKIEGLETILKVIHNNGPQQVRPDPEFPPRLSLAQSEQLLHTVIASCAMMTRQAEEKLAELQQKSGMPLLKPH